MRQVLTIIIAAGMVAGCASNDGLPRAAYPNLSDVKERPVVALTPERTEELIVILNQERNNAQAFATLGFREEQTLENAMAALDAAASIPEPQTERPSATPIRPREVSAPPAVAIETLQEQARASRPQALVEQDRVSDEALATSNQPEEILATEPDFK